MPKRRGRNMRTTLPRINMAPGGVRCLGVAGLFTDDRADRPRRRTPKCFLKQYLMAELKQRALSRGITVDHATVRLSALDHHHARVRYLQTTGDRSCDATFS